MSSYGLQLGLLPGHEMPYQGSQVYYRGGRRIVGTVNRSRKCDDRCLYAKSDKCNCACGGANHGARA